MTRRFETVLTVECAITEVEAQAITDAVFPILRSRYPILEYRETVGMFISNGKTHLGIWLLP